MADEEEWDDFDDDWDDDDDLIGKMGGLAVGGKKGKDVPLFDIDDDEEEDLLVKEKAAQKKAAEDFAAKRSALELKRAAEKERKEEEELARKAMAMEAEMEANLDPDELKRLKQRQIEEADAALTDDLFGTVDKRGLASATAAAEGDKLVLKDLKDHLKHARKVAKVLNENKKIHMVTAYIRELLQQTKETLDDTAITELIKSCNVIKNDKVQKAKRKVKGQANKSAKRDKAAEAKARKLQTELYGDNDKYDDYDQYGEDYEDAFF